MGDVLLDGSMDFQFVFSINTTSTEYLNIFRVACVTDPNWENAKLLYLNG